MDKKTTKGFSLLEIIVAIFILILMLNIIMGIGRALNDTVNLDNAVKMIETKIKLAKNKTLASVSGTNYGVHFDTASITVFTGGTYTSGTPTNEVISLPNNVKVYSISLNGGGSDIIFNRLTGATNEPGTVVISLVSDISKTRQIVVNGEGETSFNSFQSSSSALITNARHVHFALGWNIQNATTLRLEWLNSLGNVIVTNNVSTASYFNVGKTAFDWSGSTLVNGSAQSMRIHSWLDGSSNTVLCVMRDQTETYKLNIYFIDGVTKKIATYIHNADGTITVTPDSVYGGSMAIQ